MEQLLAMLYGSGAYALPRTTRSAAIQTLGVACFAWSAALIFYRHRRSALRSMAPGEVRCCVVTGAASGIGHATVLRLECLGWHILAVDIDKLAIEKLDSATTSSVRTMVCNVADPAACRSLLQRAQDMVTQLGATGLAGIANVAGLMHHLPAACVDDDGLREILAVNCEAPVRLSRLLLPLLLQHDRPVLCNVASIAASVPFIWSGCYSATKGFVTNFSDSLQREAIANRLPLRVSVVEPGFIETPMTARIPERQLEFCKSHASNPFVPGMHRSALHKLTLMNTKRLPGLVGHVLAFIGDPTKTIRSTPDAVAGDIVHALCAEHPHRRYRTATIVFRLLMFIVGLLPLSLQDKFMAALL